MSVADGQVEFSPGCPNSGEMVNGFMVTPDMVGLIMEGRAGGSPPDEDTRVLGIVFNDPASGVVGGVQMAYTPEPVRRGDVPANFAANVLGCIALCPGRAPNGVCRAFDEHTLGQLLRG